MPKRKKSRKGGKRRSTKVDSACVVRELGSKSFSTLAGARKGFNAATKKCRQTRIGRVPKRSGRKGSRQSPLSTKRKAGATPKWAKALNLPPPPNVPMPALKMPVIPDWDLAALSMGRRRRR